MLNNMEFKKYLGKLEEGIIYRGVIDGLIGKKEMVSVRTGKLSRTQFGKRMGLITPWKDSIVIDYYGHFKKSEGFIEHAKDQANVYRGRQIHMLKAMVVHFASIKIEDVARISHNSYLTAGFPEFKTTILTWRGYV